MTIKQQGGIFGRNPTFNDVDVDSSINLGDGVKLNFGDGDDLVIQHQGSYSIIEDKGTGNLLVKGTNLQLKSYSTNEMYIEMTQNGAVDLYYDGVKQAYTSSVGLAFPDGKGIDFSATSGTGTSELFDDYEEGTFTPVVADAASGGNVDPTTQRGVYTKIGRLVNITIELEDVDTATNSMSGTLFIRDLPFTPASLTGKIRYVSPVLFGSGVTFDTSYFYTAQIQDGLNYATIKEVRSGTTANNLQASALTSGSNDINMQFSYYV